ncbi:hypothetical protein FDC49_08385 [Clostridium sporogenes]|uniref:Uncharacterized protein n=2 Tax=Clostridium TaxID=1485 RepID=A0A0D1A020_CLOBO|nr:MULTISPECIES: hypothetical protein [Clostridium]MBE6075602.1 hypothetical protein [Clostridium lundense]MDU2832486.1 hypothetical protein [Clostridium botulinum]KIS24118.1 hypothetical protein N495_11170 [Clostridium botulinum B2 450]MCW7999044.1 hypothetical protein [Clostridium sp. cpc1]MDU4547023.1 hypothetical protein [Clostridium botulinum]
MKISYIKILSFRFELLKIFKRVSKTNNALNNNKPLEHLKGKEYPIYVEGKLVRETIDKSGDFVQSGERFRAMTDNVENEEGLSQNLFLG